ncbi:flagellar motor switch protein FliG [Buchnera aphidicola (Aphis helianthi)]|uniref:Flagellar motor switch protein FliG n=1 Tax=Buchnera aphidicola (Aphis helianthi) TaxID=2315802 RepID=A0A4D6XT39_9GAMM|nr:flagellar motor switch protein FliG [Buchnera aphidicola]QCI16911.1 flagellar motor switch protein FliG [Buchnera aphidicola (Aphis helianthi)]
MTLNGTEKSALLLMSIGSDQASEVLKYLTPFEVQELVTSMVNINQCSNTILNKVLTECYDIFMKNNNLVYNNNEEYISDMLTKALGDKKGNILLSDALEVRNIKMCIESLNSMKPDKLASLLKEEHTQIITTILVYLDKNQSAQILSYLSKEQRTEIIIKIAEFNGIEEKTFIELKNIVNNLLEKKKFAFSNKGGIKTVANILSSMKIENEKYLLEKIKLSNKELSNKIIKQIFLFENIVNVNDDIIKCLINYIEEEKLYIALQGTSNIIRNKFFSNMDETKSTRLLLLLKKKSYISNIAIENEQKLILMMIKNILDHGIFSLENLGKYYV